MTPKKKDKEEKEVKYQVNNEIKSDDSQKSKDKVEGESIEKEQTEIKQIEGEEPQKLEYYSKDDLLGKIQDLEKKLKETDGKLSQYQNQATDWKDKYMRLQAEFENAQKRWEKNRQDLRIQYTASTLKTFLPLYDSFKKALENENPQNDILKGFYDQFMNILKSHKAEPTKVNVNDTFDYNYHEALSSVERDDVPNNTIIDVIQDGWKLDKEVIRYSKVIISKEPKPPELEPELEEKGEKEEIKEEQKLEEKEKPEKQQEDSKESEANELKD
ncbi:MAG: nucleotide exchange factor GrpE [Candidatus Hodarchaeota archaeon]